MRDWKLIPALLAVCAIALMQNANAAQPRITVDNPRGGEIYLVGQSQVVRVNGRFKSVTVELSRDGGQTFQAIGLIDGTAHEIAQRNAFTWPVTLPASNTCVIRVTSGAFSATSGMFVITPATNVNLGGATPSGSVGTLQLADGAVTTPKLADQSVTSAKVNSGPVSPNYVLAADGNGGAAWVQGDSLVTGAAPAGNAGGDLTGTYPNPTLANNAVTSVKIAAGQITNAHVSATAAIAGTKITPDFGAQTVKTTGSAGFGTSTPNGMLDVIGAPAATSNFGLINIGPATTSFDGASAGHFAGSASGTQLALNAVAGFSGNLLDLQVNGAPKLRLDKSGDLLLNTAVTPAYNLTALQVASGPNIQGLAGLPQFGEFAVGAFEGPGGWTTLPGSNSSAIMTSFAGYWTFCNDGGLTAGANFSPTVRMQIDNAGNFSYYGPQTTTISNTATSAVSVTHSGAVAGTGYAGQFTKSGASGTNVGIFASASGGTNNYAAIFSAGRIGMGTTTPAGELDVIGAPTASNHTGVLNLGAGVASFNGGGSSFTGSASGTMLAANAASGFTGNLADLQVNGASIFRVGATGGVTIAGPLATAVNTVTGTCTVAATDSIVFANAAGGAFTVNLPTAAGIAGRQYIIKKIDSSANVVTIQANGAETIDGANTQPLAAQYAFLTLTSDGTNWNITGH